MDERPTKRRGPLLWLAGRSRRFWIIAILAPPLLYVGSFGPACWAIGAHAIPARETALAYEPLLRLSLFTSHALYWIEWEYPGAFGERGVVGAYAVHIESDVGKDHVRCWAGGP